MKPIIAVFQYEIRYNFILNFSEISRKILAPYVKLAQGIKIDKENSLEERISLNFDEDNYSIIIGWDRILIKGQENLSKFTAKNAIFQTPFLEILNKFMVLEEFGSVQNILFAITYIKKIDGTKDELVSKFMKNNFVSNASEIVEGINDVAISLEKKLTNEETFLTYGPYFGPDDLLNRALTPFNINSFDNLDFFGVMAEYKYLIKTHDYLENNLEKLGNNSKKITDKLWLMF